MLRAFGSVSSFPRLDGREETSVRTWAGGFILGMVCVLLKRQRARICPVRKSITITVDSFREAVSGPGIIGNSDLSGCRMAACAHFQISTACRQSCLQRIIAELF